MAQRLFYSWQSDVAENRAFVRAALDAAVSEIADDTTIDEAQREISVDQDTQGVPGSPPVVDAILTKIRSSDYFVADLTFVAASEGRSAPNPNVLLEYGYALHALSDARIIGVFNTASGKPKDLPFDLVHRRWPILFTVPAKGSERAAAKQKLVSSLVTAIRSIISQFGSSSSVTAQPQPAFVPAQPSDGMGGLRSPNDYLCLAPDDSPVFVAPGSYAFFRLIPAEVIRPLSVVECQEITQRSLQPMTAARGGGWTTGRHRSGSVSYWTGADNPRLALDASELFLTGELWGQCNYVLNPSAERRNELGFAYIPTGFFEETIIDTLVNFRTVARDQLRLSLPLEIQTGIVGVENYRLAVDPDYFAFDRFAGRILDPTVVFESTLEDWRNDPFDLLLPFFTRIYDSAGITRPNVRSVGRRQR